LEFLPVAVAQRKCTGISTTRGYALAVYICSIAFNALDD
jgi:hypothetical protein